MSLIRSILLLSLASIAQAQAPTTTRDVPIPEKVPSPVSEEGAPTVTIRARDNGDRVEEYRTAGKLTMVRVTPRHGRPYYLYDDNHDGRMDRSDIARGDVSPVYWTIADWK